MQKAAARFSAEVPYDAAAQLFQELAGQALNDYPVHQEAAMARLFWGEVYEVIWGPRRMRPKDAQAGEAASTR